MENIIINFTSDPSGLQPGIDGLVEMQIVDKNLAEQVKKTSAEVNKRTKAIKDGSAQSSSSVDKLAGAFKGLDKNIVGGAYKKSLTDLQKEIAKGGDEFKQLATVIEFTKSKMASLDPNSDEWKDLNSQVGQAEELLKIFGDEAEQTGQRTQSMRSRLRELKIELQQLEDQGQDNTQHFRELQVEAAQLEDQIGDTNERIKALASDSANFDAILGAVSAVSAGFEVAAGAEALFGAASEDVEKALVKLNAVMALTNGLRQIQEALKAQSIVRLKAESIWQGILAASTRATAATFGLFGVSVAGTSVAFKVLRTAIITTGIGALVVGIGFLIDRISQWTSSSESAIDTQNRLADATQGLNEAIVEQNNLYVKAISATKEDLEKQLTLLQTAGGSQLRQLGLRRQIAEEDKKIGENILKNLGLTENKVLILENKISSNLKKIQEANILSQNASKEDQETYKKIAENFRKEIEADAPLYEAGKAAVDQIASASIAAVSVVNETSQILSENALKSASAFAEARVLLAKAGSQEEFNARIDSLKAQQREELANVNLTAGERSKIIANTEKQITDLRSDFAKRALVDSKAGIDAQAILATEGTKQELDFKLQSLAVGKQIELSEKELTENQKLEIEASFQKQRIDLIKSYNQKVAGDAINSRIAEINTTISTIQLSQNQETNAALLEAKQQLLDEEAALEVLNIQESEKNEELRRLKIKAVYAKVLTDKQQLERDKNQADINAGLQSSQTVYNAEIARNQFIIQSAKFTAKQKIEAQAEVFRYEIASLDASALANQQSYEQGLITFADFLQKKNELSAQYGLIELQKEQETLNIRKKIVDTAFGLIQSATDTFFSAQAEKRQADLNRALDALNTQKDVELSNAKLTSDQKDQINKKYALQEAALKKKAFEDDKKAKKVQAQINGALAITNILATRPKFDLGIGDAIMIAAAIASTAIQIAAIEGAEVPSFSKGKVRIMGPGTDTSDSIPARISRNESVINAAMTKKHEAVLRAINENRYHDYLMKNEMPKLTQYYQTYSMVEPPEFVQNVPEPIDYEKLGEVIANKMGDQMERIPVQSLRIDEDGFHASVRKGNEEINYINKKLVL